LTNYDYIDCAHCGKSTLKYNCRILIELNINPKFKIVMKIEIIWHSPSTNVIDLEDYGHEENTSWDDISENDKNEILDALRDEIIPMPRDIRDF
jgi:hypothetical protein